MDNQPFNAELQHLAELLEAKKQTEAVGGDNARPEKELFTEVVNEHLQTVLGAVPERPIHPAAAAKPVLSVTDQLKLDQLVRQVFTNGLAAAINEARATTDAYLLDNLHDRLADEYYQKLVEARQVNAA